MEQKERLLQLNIEKEKIEKAIESLIQSGFSEEDYSEQKHKLNSIKTSIANIEEEIRDEEELEIRKTFDWSKVEDTEVREAWNRTKETYDSTKFNANENNYKIVKGALLSTASDERGILLQGPTGTGKTTLVAHLGGLLNVPVVSQNYSNGTEEQDVIGGFVPTVNKETGENVIVVKDGPLVTAMKYGLVYVAEEINFAKPGILAILNTVLDGNGTIVTSDNRVIKAHKNFKFVGTLNPGYKGTRAFNKSLVNRFGTIAVIEQPSAKQLVVMLNAKTGYGNSKEEIINIIKMVSLLKLITEEIESRDFDAAASVRQLISMTRHLKRGTTFFNSSLYGIVNQVANLNNDLTKLIIRYTKEVDALPLNEIEKLAENSLPSNILEVFVKG